MALSNIAEAARTIFLAAYYPCSLMKLKGTYTQYYVMWYSILILCILDECYHLGKLYALGQSIKKNCNTWWAVLKVKRNWILNKYKIVD